MVTQRGDWRALDSHRRVLAMGFRLLLVRWTCDHTRGTKLVRRHLEQTWEITRGASAHPPAAHCSNMRARTSSGARWANEIDRHLAIVSI